jgi:hypothetical protein
LQTGDITLNQSINRFFSLVFPLFATGGPGAARIILLSCCIYFFGPSATANFAKDIFIVLILNTFLCQGFSFFLYKDKYKESFWLVLKQSLWGAISAIPILYLLYLVNIVEQYLLSVLLTWSLHFYFIFRIKLLVEKRFIILSIVEIILSLSFIFFPFMIINYHVEIPNLPYVLYILGLVVATLIMLFFVKNECVHGRNKLPLSIVKNIAIANVVGPFSLFSLPVIVSYFANDEITTLVALCILFCNVIFLIPRSYANTFLPELGKQDFDQKNLAVLDIKYTKVACVSAVVGCLTCLLYVALLIESVTLIDAFFYSFSISLVLLSSQLGLVFLTYASLSGSDKKVMSIHLKTFVMSMILFVFIIVFANNTHYFLLSSILFSLLSLIFYIRRRMAIGLYVKTIQI